MAMKRYGEALADLNRAIELDPSLDWAIASCCYTCRLMKRYAKALTDLKRDLSDSATTERTSQLPR